MLISLFSAGAGAATRNPIPTDNLEFRQFIKNVQEGVYYTEVMNYREKKTDVIKKKMTAVSPSGRFKKQGKDGLEQHSGLICIDIDAKDNEDVDIKVLLNDEYLLAMHLSTGGEGYAAYFRIEPEKHLDAYLALEKRLAEKYHLIVDPACKDVGRLRFVSHDPNAYVAKGEVPVFKNYLPKVKAAPMPKIYPHGEHDIDYIIDQIESQRIDLTDSYLDWIKIGFAIASKYGDDGIGLFHRISAINNKYNPEDCERKYRQLVKSRQNSVSFATFMYMCKNAGIDIQSNKTKHIVNTVKTFKLRVGTNGGPVDTAEAGKTAIKILRDIDQVDVEGLERIVAETIQLDNKELKAMSTDSVVKQIKQFLRSYNLRFNAITRNIELDGEPITDRKINNIYLECLEAFGKKDVTMQLVTSIVDSDFVIEYNPFKEFFAKNGYRFTEGQISALARSIKTNNQDLVYVEMMLRKWLCSVVASMHGEYSVIILVMCGAQGIGKTNFFRYLLPEELQSYYAESKLDSGKDDEILMCKKIILCDDEFGGKSKQEAKKLKELSSKQTFSIRKPYGKVHEDLNRYAVLCGTSNDDEVINDPTGNRRILPIMVADIDWRAYKAVDKADLFMEAFRLYHTEGEESWQLSRENVTYLDALTKGNVQPNLEKELLLEFYTIPENQRDPRGEWYTNTEIKVYIELTTRQHISQYKLGSVLKALGVKKHNRADRGYCGCYFLVKKWEKSNHLQRIEIQGEAF
jgi:predicted P-loop ATPase